MGHTFVSKLFFTLYTNKSFSRILSPMPWGKRYDRNRLCCKGFLIVLLSILWDGTPFFEYVCGLCGGFLLCRSNGYQGSYVIIVDDSI